MSKKQISVPISAADIKGWSDLAFDESDPNKMEKLKKDQLSVYVDHHKLQGSSPKMMIVYIKMHLASQIKAIQDMYPGENLAEFKVPRLKKELAKCGILPEGSYAELSTKLLETDKFKTAIRNRNNDSSDSKKASDSQSQQSKGMIDSEMLAKEVLRRGEAGDYEGILSLLGTKITEKSTVGEMRKAYLKLSLLIHPDKLQNYPDAKKAFQELVSAFERLSRPEDFKEKQKAGANTSNKTTLKRSNNGCMRTEIKCPRCRVVWNTQLDGNPDFAYTLMMTGIKTYHCSTCLLEFGCISAIHKCPHCRKGFEYHPDDFHRKVTCGNQGCNREFGFYEDYIQDRVMKEIKEQIMTEFEKRMKRDEAKKRRAKQQSMRNQLSPEEQKKQEEQAYLIGLNDLCPKCGIHLKELDEDVDQYRHLRECNDEVKQKEYQQKKKQQKKEEQIKEQIKEKQNQTQNEAVFNAFGAQNTMLWMLTEEQLKKQCEISQIDTEGSKEELIARLAEHRKDQKALGGYGGSAQTVDDRSTIPNNLQGMSEQALRGVMLSQGMNPDKYKSKKSMVNALERIKLGIDLVPDRKMIGDDPNRKKEESKQENNDSDSDIDNEEDESDYELPSDDERSKKPKSKWSKLKYQEGDNEEINSKRENPVEAEEYESNKKKKKRLVKAKDRK